MNSRDFEKIERAEDKLRRYYEMRGQVGKREVLGKEALEIESAEEQKENDLVKEMEGLRQEVQTILDDMGLQINDSTGEIIFENNNASPDDTKEKIKSAQEKVNNVSNEYKNSTNLLYGQDNFERTPNEQNEERTPGVKEQIIEQKQEQIKRDVSARKLLKERADLEAIKDAMDMDAALHVARKNRLLLRMEQLKLDIAKKLSSGANKNDMSLMACQVELQGLANEVLKLENDFAARRDMYSSEFDGCRAALESSQKSVLLERENARDNRNKYSRNLDYSEDGVLAGTTTQGTRDGRTINEKEIFDERGVMIFDVADVISREKSVNIDGVEVRCVAEFDGHNIDDTYYIGNEEKLNVDVNGNEQIIEEKPDVEKEVHETNTGKPTQINMVQDILESMIYQIAGEYVNDLSNVSPNIRNQVAKGLLLLGYDREKGSMSPDGLNGLRNEIVKRAIEFTKQLAEELAQEGELPPPKIS